MQKRKEAGVWQRRFYDHILRTEEDIKKHVDYIRFNSFNSFKKFVDSGYYDENWCNFDYNDLDLE